MDDVVTADALSIYRGLRVLVIGDTGFKGSWLALWLRELGAKVTGMALPAEPDGHFNAIGLAHQIRHIDGDIRDLSCLQQVFEEVRPECVFHLAAQSLVMRSYDEPKLTFDTNIGGSVNVLEAVRMTPSVRTLVYVTSDKCYHNKEWVWGYRETDELGGPDPYSASKAAAELVFSAYLLSYFANVDGLGAASVRAGNVIGGGDWARNRIVPDCIRFLKENRPIQLRNPSSTRPWQHVLEPLGGYLVTASRLMDDPKRLSGSWNFGPRGESVRTVEDLARQIVTHWGGGEIRSSPSGEDRVHEARLLQLNCDKARSLLGWQQKWTFERTVQETIRWYRTTHLGRDPLEISREQIRAYMDKSHD